MLPVTSAARFDNSLTFFFQYCICEREQVGEGQREGGQKICGLYADSREPDVGLDLTNWEIVT